MIILQLHSQIKPGLGFLRILATADTRDPRGWARDREVGDSGADLQSAGRAMPDRVPSPHRLMAIVYRYGRPLAVGC